MAKLPKGNPTPPPKAKPPTLQARRLALITAWRDAYEAWASARADYQHALDEQSEYDGVHDENGEREQKLNRAVERQEKAWRAAERVETAAAVALLKMVDSDSPPLDNPFDGAATDPAAGLTVWKRVAHDIYGTWAQRFFVQVPAAKTRERSGPPKAIKKS
jgi:hypothetical protein